MVIDENKNTFFYVWEILTVEKDV